MRIASFFSSIGGGFIGFLFKLLFFMMLFVFIIAFIVVLAVHWPFTIALLIGLFLSEQMYRRLSRKLNIRLPKYFYITHLDLLASFSYGDVEMEILREELQKKTLTARTQLIDLQNASNSIDNEFNQLKVKRSLKTLFKRNVSVNSRVAKALSMELGKSRWTQYIDKANQSSNEDWAELMA